MKQTTTFETSSGSNNPGHSEAWATIAIFHHD